MEWQSIDKCPVCGSCNLDKDYDMESYTCTDCGSGGGGANFWK